MNNRAIQLRDGLFIAGNRVYGETYIEPMIRYYYNLDYKLDDSHDAVGYDDNGMPVRYEIKATKVLTPPCQQGRTMADEIIAISGNDILTRMIHSNDACYCPYNSNIQNVKCDDFDYLIYMMLFEDSIYVFGIESENVKTCIPNWSDKHGRYDEEGKSGQFPISAANFNEHCNFLKDILPWDDVLGIYENL